MKRRCASLGFPLIQMAPVVFLQCISQTGAGA